MKKFLFWFPWSVSALVASVAIVFFLIGLADGTVSSFNALLWFGLLTVVLGCVGGSWILRGQGKQTPAILLAWVLAVPGLFAFLMMLLVIILQPRWN